MTVNNKAESITIYQRQDEIAIHFNSLEEFKLYYDQNKEVIDKEPTRGLNRKYRIKGYKITRKKSQMTAIPINNNNTVDDLMESIMLMDDKLNAIQHQLNSLKLHKE
jgi:hypothetical protein